MDDPEIDFTKVLIHCISWSAFGVKNMKCVRNWLTSLNPLYVVECFRRVASPGPYKSRVPEGVFLPDFLSTTFESTFFRRIFR